MKLYWREPNGDFPPEDACFFSIPFGLNIPPSPLNDITRVHELPPLIQPISVIKRQFLPSKENWIKCIKSTLEQIDEGHFTKAVLARKCTLECQTPIDPFALLSHLKECTQNATLFCIANETSAFLGASPEKLFTRRGNQISVEAVAGTTRRGNSPKEDLLLEEELLKNETKLNEIKPVQAFIQEVLTSLCKESPRFSNVGIKKTKNVQHLHATATATLKENVSDLEIAMKLHPTPALCGTPQANALDWILKQEPFRRGLYGGILGWSTKEVSNWIVAIRCSH